MIPFERRGSDRGRRDHGRARHGGVDPSIEVAPSEPERARRRTLLLAIPLALVIVVFAVEAANLEPIVILQIAFATLFVVGVGWVVVALTADGPERVHCPACARRALTNTRDGLTCKACGWDGETRDRSPESDVDEIVDVLERRRTLGDHRRRW
ncbi:MAG: hypothetical protein K8S98_18045 [Planctomycetes bacterium]|nr:hypothetical protein [Planctomycetota bacterium]